MCCSASYCSALECTEQWGESDDHGLCILGIEALTSIVNGHQPVMTTACLDEQFELE